MVMVTALLLASCAARRMPTLLPKTDTTIRDTVLMRDTVRDTIVKVQADSSMLRALLECDSLGKVRIKQLLDYKAGDRTKIPMPSIDDNVLTLWSFSDSLNIYLKLKYRYEKHISDHSTDTVQPVEVNRLTWWQTLWIGVGKVMASLTVLGLIIKLIKPKIL